MTTVQNVQVKIDLTAIEPALEPEQLELLTLSLAEGLKELTEETSLVRASEIPEGSKPGLAGFIWGILQTEVTFNNLQAFLNYLGQRFKGKTLKLEFSANGKSCKIVYSGHLEDAVQAIKQLFEIE